jgi:hypothetical protein
MVYSVQNFCKLLWRSSLDSAKTQTKSVLATGDLGLAAQGARTGCEPITRLPIHSTRFTGREDGGNRDQVRSLIEFGFWKENRGCVMQAIGCADRYVIGRENNVVIVDFRRPDPPPRHFPSAGALRAAVVEEEENDAGSWSLKTTLRNGDF